MCVLQLIREDFPTCLTIWWFSPHAPNPEYGLSGRLEAVDSDTVFTLYFSRLNVFSSLLSLWWTRMAWPKPFPQSLQLQSFCPVWILQWILRSSLWLKSFPHSLHLYGFSPVENWTWHRKLQLQALPLLLMLIRFPSIQCLLMNFKIWIDRSSSFLKNRDSLLYGLPDGFQNGSFSWSASHRRICVSLQCGLLDGPEDWSPHHLLRIHTVALQCGFYDRPRSVRAGGGLTRFLTFTGFLSRGESPDECKDLSYKWSPSCFPHIWTVSLPRELSSKRSVRVHDGSSAHIHQGWWVSPQCGFSNGPEDARCEQRPYRTWQLIAFLSCLDFAVNTKCWSTAEVFPILVSSEQSPYHT